MKIKACVMMLFAVLMIVACKPADKQRDPVHLEGTNWVLLTLDGQAPLPATTITAAFSEGKITGQSGCNSYFGAYTLSGDRMTFDTIGMTEMACLEPEGVMAQETTYLEILGAVAEVHLIGGQLELRTERGQVLVFAPVGPVPETMLERAGGHERRSSSWSC